MIVMIDNYDSFTYNLVQYFGELGEEIKVFRNDKITIEEIEALKPDRIVISPGPCDPSKAGISLAVIKHFAGKLPILGVCLGHQSIGQAFGGKIVRAKKLMHGKTSTITHTGKGVFAGLKKQFEAVRYHSLVIDRNSLPDCLEITAESDDGEIMGIKHKEFDIEGVQFHPESILTSQGKLLLANFLANKSLISKVLNIRDAIGKITNNQDLTEDEAAMVMEQIMSGEATSSQTSSFITAMRMKGEQPEEILGLVKTMREQSLKVHPKSTGLLDTCGTGGDALNTFNISTTAAFVACAAGAKIAKHGNRAASSKCGSADVLEELGVKIDLTPEQVAKCIDEIGMGFMFAPKMHPAMKHAVIPRKEIGIRTFFNFIGPLTNPASCEYQIIGAFSDKVTDLAASVLLALGSKKAMVVHGMAGLDEISTVGETKISEIVDGKIKTYFVKPEDFGIVRRTAEEISLVEGDVKENAEILLSILKGEKGARRDIVLVNAAAALVVTGIAESIREGIGKCKQAIDSGAALEKLEQLKKISQEFESN